MRKLIALGLAGVAMAAPAHSAVTASGETGFAVENSIDIAADAGEVYALLATPGRWWNGEHSVGGDAANLGLEAKAGAVSAKRCRPTTGRQPAV